jgi:hypothetical protein
MPDAGRKAEDIAAGRPEGTLDAIPIGKNLAGFHSLIPLETSSTDF